jgi:hypothetical protein
MIAQIFLVIQLLLKLFGLWEQFLEWGDKKRAADAEARAQEREKAIEDAKKATTPDEAFDAQDRITHNSN